MPIRSMQLWHNAMPLARVIFTKNTEIFCIKWHIAMPAALWYSYYDIVAYQYAI